MAAQTQYIMSADSTKIQHVAGACKLNVLATIWSNPNYKYGVYAVAGPASSTPAQVMASVQQEMADADVASFEPNQTLNLPEALGATSAALAQSTTAILDTLPGRVPLAYFGTTVPSNYVQQPAASIIRLADAFNATGLAGAGAIAVIDTGVDPNHAALAGVLVPGFDFTRNVAGIPSELNDLSPSAAAALDQSTTAILDGQSPVQLNASTLAILDQSTTAILDNANLPAEFGHGTMTAGLVHLIAPRAKIMPLKAFAADGSSDIISILRAIYYAADHGANVISMSFEMTQSSPGIASAIGYAQSHGAITVASAGNDNAATPVTPASLPNVLGVGSTSNSDVKSAFSNFGCADVMFAAPGEGVITTYPGNNYAAAWGTSFSAPMVAGATALLQQQKPGIQLKDVVNSLWRALKIPQMGHGRIDLFQALAISGSGGGGGDDGCSSGGDGGGSGGGGGSDSGGSGKGKGGDGN